MISDLLAGHFQIALRELIGLLNNACKFDSSLMKNSCFIYPEVSANVQGFVRSRVSAPGIYLFSDTGAGSVDQSVFIFLRENQRELLSYLHGSVLPLGSSHIEQIAARIAADRGDNRQSLEYWRIKKESGESDPILESAKNEIAWKLCQGTETTLAHARRKLYVRDQLFQIRIIFGGGGHCKHPYETGTMRSFQGRLFTRPIKPDIVGLPSPNDLEKPFQQNWFKRLSVAYGLSFIKAELTPFKYPQENEKPEPQEIWQPKKALSDAPTKDQC
ncbi:MAG: hypothetical protein D6690_05225 [Nitrospirae bacterium]|nr:MAG: hypothetical protein D6690_05225 [Nitrospirota bacterium]